MGHFLGPKKLISWCRDTDDAAMTAASMESCRFVVRRSLGGRFWSVVDMRKRLRRVRRRFQSKVHLPKVLCAITLLAMICQSFRSIIGILITRIFGIRG